MSLTWMTCSLTWNTSFYCYWTFNFGTRMYVVILASLWLDIEMSWIALFVLDLLVAWVLIPLTVLRAGGPNPYWLVGRVELARVWSRRSMNQESCHLNLNVNVHLSSWTWTGILEYYPFLILTCGPSRGLYDGWRKTWSGDILDIILEYVDGVSMTFWILIKRLELTHESPVSF